MCYKVVVVIGALILLLCATKTSHAQQFTHLHQRLIKVSKDTLMLDSLTLVDGSLLVLDKKGNRIDSANYVLDDFKGTLIWLHPPKDDSVKVIYRTFPFSFGKSYFNKDVRKIEHTTDFIVNPFSYSPNDAKKSATLDFGTLDYNGSFARGISFGNNQDAVVNSNFNLQLSGNLTPEIEIKAAISDNNIPIQPDGNTQQLQQFDKIFIEITKKPHKLIVGDFEVGSPRGYFMKFYKNLEGGGYRTTLTMKDSSVFRTSVNLAIAKGKFSKSTLKVTEGNQGPYKLTGANGETFIIVLAGTERVFVNGQLKKRGAENDYVVDYNLGEISFTPNMLITQDLRVSVEFQYSDKNYFRSFIYVNNEYDRKKAKFNLNFYSEQDSKNQPVQADLSADEKKLLSTIGNDLSKAYYSGYSQQAYDPNRILYRLKKDSLVNGIIYDSVFVYTTSATDTTYGLNFSYTGPNGGNYAPSITTANGRVFQWVAPVNGVPQGSYQPIVVLITPKRQQMYTAGLEYTPTKKDVLNLEAAMSNSNNNLFSSIDNKKNFGTAEKASYKRKFEFGSVDTAKIIKDSTKMPFQIILEASYEFLNHNFKPLERFRPVEFSRNWNYAEHTGDTIDQHLGALSVTFAKPGWVRESYLFNAFYVQGYYKGTLHTISGAFNHWGFRVEHLISILNTAVNPLDSTANMQTIYVPGQKSIYIRPKILAEKSFKKLKNWKIGGVYEHENNKVRDALADTLLNSSFVFTDWRTYIATPDSNKYKIRLEYVRRLEFKPDTNHLYLATVSNTFNFTGEWATNKHMALKWQTTYRRFLNRDSLQYNKGVPEDYYLGRVEYSLNLLKGAITANTLYELGSGKEQRISYTYLPVAAGLGNYVWRDYNHDGVKQASEFELASFTEDTMYVRVLNPTNEFDAVNVTQFNQVLNFNPRVLTKGKKGFVDFLGRFSTVTSLQINRKVYRNANISPFNPFILDVSDTSLVSINQSIRNSIFFNRTGAIYSLEYTFTDNKGKTNLSNGFESRKQREHLMRIRWNMSKSVNSILKATTGYRANSSDAYQDRNYDIRYYTAEPELNWLFKSKFRVTLTYAISVNSNTLSGGNGERAFNNQATIDLKYSLVTKTSINTRFSFTNVSYNGTADNALEYAMLQGLKNGKNYIWSVSFDRTIGKNIQLNLTYEGHKTGDVGVVHTGRAQVRALF